jgi:hypothetical protein
MWVRLRGGRNIGRVIEVRDENAPGMLATGMAVRAKRGDPDDPPPAPLFTPATTVPTEPPAQFSVSPNAERSWSVVDIEGNTVIDDAANRLSAIHLAWKLGSLSLEERQAFVAARAAEALAIRQRWAEERRMNPGHPGPQPVHHLGEFPTPPVHPGGEIVGPKPAPSEPRRRPGVFFS